MRVWSAMFVALLVMPSAALAADRTLFMEVEKPKDSFVTERYFDDMAGSAGTVARTKDSTQDVSCGLSVARSGDIVEHQTLPKEITTHAQLNRIAQLPVDVFVMDQLSVCGSYVNEPAVAGCERPGPILVEAGSLAHLTLIHEAGHKADLHHSTPRAQCEDDPGLTLAPALKKNNIMFCKRQATRTWMTNGDCNTLKATPAFSGGSADLDGTPSGGGDANIAQNQLPGVSPTQELLANLFGEGIDFAAIAALTDEQIEAIRNELRGDDHRFWEQAAYVLGIRGTPDDLETIVALAHRAANIPTPEGYRARSAVPEAIGLYLAYHKDAPDTDWLKTFLLSNVAPGNSRVLGNGEDEVVLLSNRYAMGAALSGDLDLAQSTLDILAADARDAELQESIAARAIASNQAPPELVLNGEIAPMTNAREELFNRVNNLGVDVNPELIDVLRDEGLTMDSVVVQRFKTQQFGPGVIGLDVLDQRVEDLLIEQTNNQ